MSAAENPLPFICPHWVVSNRADHCIAKDITWFTKYTPFDSRLENGLLIDGYGTVLIHVEICAAHLPPLQHLPERGQILIRNVLHVPDFEFNVVAEGCLRGLAVTSHYPNAGIYMNGKLMASFVPYRLPHRVIEVCEVPDRISEGAPGYESGLEDIVDMRWSKAECMSCLRISSTTSTIICTSLTSIPTTDKRWRLFKSIITPARALLSQSERPDSPTALEATQNRLYRAKALIDLPGYPRSVPKLEDPAPYTQSEAKWLVPRVGSERQMLESIGLSIDDEDERKQGAWLTRLLMEMYGPGSGKTLERKLQD